ncbi:uroporphyrin-III C-methyltransferase [Rhizoctonia solani]|uniref:Uroporphyrin-III C-methyltransferase n=1 Tax=Rhizoctonia solani TaxID=456999 RepID=A0A0K6GIY4_9AGAM|nr:uroporphyrin-III C-methyltransferase [Rhizoctonia solani]
MPSLCDFTFPATHRFPLSSQCTDPNLRTVDVKGSALQLAVTANGHGCRLASRLKREVIARLPRNVGDAVDNVGRLRHLARSQDEDPEALSSAIAMHDSGVQFGEEDDPTPINKPVPQRTKDETPAERCARRMRWVAQLSEYTSLEQLAMMDDAAMKEVLESRATTKSTEGGKCAHKRSNSPKPSISAEPETTIPSQHHLVLSPPPRSNPTLGRIILVGSGPGHPGLLTRAAHHAITSLATLILADKLVPAEIMAIIPKHVEVRVAKKYPGNAEHAQDEFIQLAIEGARAGKCVVRLKQGDPYLYGRGGEELLAFQSVQPPLPYPPLVIPGISSALAAPLLSTIPVTQRNVADSLVICTAVGKGGKGGVVLGYERTRSIVILMGVARLGELVRCLITGTSEGAATGKRIIGGLSSTKPVVVVPVVPVAPVPTAPGPIASSLNSSAATVAPISTSTSTPSQTITPQPPSPNPNAPPTPITSPLTLSGPTYPPSTPIAIIERASMPDQRVIATSLDRVERALEREGGGRPPGMIIVGWAVVALAKSGLQTREETGGGILDIKGDGLGLYDEARDRTRLEQWLGGREYIVREGMEDGWEVFASLGA